MKQKYAMERNPTTGELILKEYAELDKGLFSLIFEETYSAENISAAIKEGVGAVITAIRTPSLYPIAEYAEKIAEKIIATFENPSLLTTPEELVFNDVKLMQKARKEPMETENAVEIDDLLADDTDAVAVEDDLNTVDDIEDIDDLDGDDIDGMEDLDELDDREDMDGLDDEE